MSTKAKKKISSISFSMNRFYRRISTAKPSMLIISIIAIATAIFLFGGGLYNIIMKPLPSVYYGGRFYFLYPELGSQFVFDTVFATVLYGLGIVGLLAAYQSTKYAYNPRQAYMTLVTGFVLLFLAYIFLEVLIKIKLGR